MTTKSKIAAAQQALPEDVQEAVKALDAMNVPKLRDRYREVFKEDSRSHNGPWLRKRIGYRIQEIAYGGLSERAKARIQELAADAPIRRRGFPVRTAPGDDASKDVATPVAPAATARDPRLPPAGTAIRRQHGSKVHTVVVEEDGFVFRGRKHESLSGIARLITGSSWNGFTFFGLTKPWGTP